MRIAKYLVAAVAALSAFAPSASADPTLVTGYNNGDMGVLSLTVNSGVGSTSDNPEQGLLDTKCKFHQVTTPSSNDTVLVVEGASVTGLRNGHRATTSVVRCRLENADTGAMVFDEDFANETAVGVWVPQVLLSKAASFRVCSEAWAVFADASIVRTDKLECLEPSLLP